MVVDEDFFGRFVGGRDVRREEWSVDYDADDFVGPVSEGVREFAEVGCVVDGEVAEEERAVAGEVFREEVLLLEGLDVLDDGVEGEGVWGLGWSES